MESHLFHNLNLTGELYDHRIGQYDSFLEAVNSTNIIQVKTTIDSKIRISYNILDNKIEEEIKLNQVYDFYIQLLKRGKALKIEPRNGELLTIENWLQIEGKTVIETLKDIEEKLNYDRIIWAKYHKERIQVEYFRGILILIDERGLFLSNVLPFRNAVQQAV